MAKISSGGQFAWATAGTNAETGNDLVVDSSGNVFVTGYFGDTAAFGSTVLVAKYQAPWGTCDIFVARLSPAGKFNWGISAGGYSDDKGNDIALDSSGVLHVCGMFSGQATFGSTSLTSAGNSSAFVWKNPK